DQAPPSGGAAMRDESLGIRFDGRSDFAGYSGLKRIGVEAFLAQTESELTRLPDGSSVKVGVADTGITYNHPAFEDAEGNNRIVYLKDFTNEGLMHFSNAAQFQVSPHADSAATDKLLLTAEFLMPPNSTSLPTADVFSKIENQE